MLKRLLSGIAAVALGVAVTGEALAQAKEIRWGVSRVGSSGHRALVNLAELLGKEMKDYQFTVQPTPGAIVSVKGYATGEFEGYYGADIAFYELANDSNRFKGFKEGMKRQPVQSFWTFTVETGVGIHRRDMDKYKKWGDLAGKRVFTGPRPWDVRANTERAFDVLGIKHEYIEVDIGTAGSLLESGRIDAFGMYTNAEATTAPWIIEAGLATDWVVLSPSAEELDALTKAGFTTTKVKASVLEEDVGAEEIVLLPFYYGFHVGTEVPADDVYRMLTIIEKNAKALAEADKGFTQIAADMAGMQRRGVEAAAHLVPIHAGLAKYMRERGVWDAKWDDRVADATN